MGIQGFTEQDFDVFATDGLDARMNAIKTRIWPKFEAIGETLAPTLSALTGEEIYPHIARHARRKVNPPDNTWIAFAANKRGYKKWPHFQIGLWEDYLFIWFAVIDEAQNKPTIAEVFDNHRKDIQTMIPNHYVWSKNHMTPNATAHSDADIPQMIKRLKNVKKSEMLCGQNIKRNDAILTDGDKLRNEMENTFKTVLPLYQWATKA